MDQALKVLLGDPLTLYGILVVALVLAVVVMKVFGKKKRQKE